MKALTLTQPWATLVMIGAKRVETRRMLFKHRGQLWIHASRFLDTNAFVREPFASALAAKGITHAEHLPLGKILGTVDVVDGVRFSADPWPYCVPPHWRAYAGEHEGEFGDYRQGRAGLLLADPSPLIKPTAARGMNGLWNWDPPAEALR